MSFTELSISAKATHYVKFQFETEDAESQKLHAVAEILGVDVDPNQWYISDVHQSLHLIHYVDGVADMSVYGHLRGALVDLETKALLWSQFSYSPVVEVNHVKHVKSKNQSGIDISGHFYNDGDYRIQLASEGVIIRTIWHKGEQVFFTHRRFNPVRSKFAGSPPFMDLYKEAAGPAPEVLFDVSKPNSSTCYSFLLGHKTLAIASRLVKDTTTIELKAIDHFEPGRESAPGLVTFDNSPVPVRKELSLREANNYLKSDPQDLRLGNGEALVIYQVDQYGQMSNTIKIHSPSYAWRAEIRASRPNVRHLYYELIDQYISKTNKGRLTQAGQDHLINFKLVDLNSLSLPVHSLEIHRGNFPASNYKLHHLILLNLIVALPDHMQESVVGLLDKIHDDRQVVSDWIKAIIDRGTIILPQLESRSNFLRVPRQLKTTIEHIQKPSPYSLENRIKHVVNNLNASVLYAFARCRMTEMRLLEEPSDATPSDATPSDAAPSE